MRRDKHRAPRERQVLELMRELDTLSDRFPPWSLSINRLSRQLRFALKPSRAKQKLIVDALRRFDCLGLDELVEETHLDCSDRTHGRGCCCTAVEVIAPMVGKRIELCARNGEPYRVPAGTTTDALGRALNSINRLNNHQRAFFRLKTNGGK